jgi:replicative DNA helicase
MTAALQPPNSIPSEQSVLGGLMLRPDALSEIADWLTPNDFWRRDHQLIFVSILEMAAKGNPIDAVTLGEWFESQGIAELVGGSRYVMQLANTTASAANIAAYAEIVREKSRLRQAMDIAAVALKHSGEAGARSADVVADATRALSLIATDSRYCGLRSTKPDVADWIGAIAERFEAKQEITGCATRWKDLTNLTAGWQPGLIVVAGRPSMGKSVFGFQCAVHEAFRGRAALFSLEMRRDEVVQRAIADLGSVNHDFLRKPGLLTDEDWTRVTAASSKLREANLLIDDQPAVTSAQIVARAKREHMRAPLTMIVVDHLHEMKVPGKDRVNELGDATRELRALGKQLGIPVILLAQLNRSNLSRSDHRPNMGDLRQAGAIEEIADMVLLLHREDYYDRSTHLSGIIELIVAKGRNMPVGESIYLDNMFQYMRMESRTLPLPKPAPKAKKGKGFDAEDYAAKDGE